MEEESFILVSLKDDKAKQLAQVISNDTSRKILDLLSKKELTETEISTELNVPISTVHYNLTHLLEARLVQIDEFHYSSKGKEVQHYKLSNKIVIIAPEQSKVETFREKLKKLIPSALICAAVAGGVKIFSGSINKSYAAGQQVLLESSKASDSIMLASSGMPQTVSEPNTVLWFFIGTVFALGVYFIIDLITKNQ